jgi:hypothetical protein
MSKLSKKDR